MKLILPLVIVIGLLAGCSTPVPQSNAPTATRDEVSPQPNKLSELKKGMSANEVVALLGQPSERKQEQVTPVHVEVWTYIIVSTEQREVAISTRDVPYIDPFSGAQKTMKEPVYAQETTKTTLKVDLLVIEDRLIEWKVKKDVSRSTL